MKDTRTESSLSVPYEKVTGISSSRISYSENGIAFKSVTVEINAEEQAYNLFFKDDYDTNQLLEYLTHKIG